MEINLFDKEGAITTSSTYFAYNILKVFENRKTKSLSFFKLMKYIKNMDRRADGKQISFALMFLFMAGIIVLDGSDIVILEPTND